MLRFVFRLSRTLQCLDPKFFHFCAHQEACRFTLPSLLKNCAYRLDIAHGRRTHARILQMGLQSDPYIASSLISLYSKCDHLWDAVQVFNELPHRDATTWNTMVTGYFLHKCMEEALSWLKKMQLAGVKPNGHSLTILLTACGDGCLGLDLGVQVHGFLVRNLFYRDSFALTALIHMYSRAGQIARALQVFEAELDKSVSMWNAIISGFCYNGFWVRSLELFILMMNEGCEVWSKVASSVIAACSMGGAIELGEGVHCFVIKMGFEQDTYVSTSLITFYANVGSVDRASKIFDSLPNKTVPLWNSVLSAFVHNDCASEALACYNKMLSFDVVPDSITISNVLSACSMISQWLFGRKIHGLLIRRPDLRNKVVQNSLISMYMRSGDVSGAKMLFSSMEERDDVILSSMITGFCQNKNFNLGLGAFNQYRAEGFIPDSGTFSSLIPVCTALDCVQLGLQIHTLAIKNGTNFDIFVGSALIDLYSKFGFSSSAGNIFSAIPNKNVVVWNSMISGYSHNGLITESISTFIEMTQSSDLFPDSVSITSVLVSISSLAALAKGKMIHGYLVRNGIQCDNLVSNSFIDMYMKCGCLRYAQVIFGQTSTRNIVAWNTMIAGYGCHGHCLKAIELFDEMQRLKVTPDGTTFLSLISSCSHSGLVEEGRRIYNLMINDYGIKPTLEHYADMVDLFSRAGCLDEAYDFIKAMPLEPSESMWLCFLSACRSHRALHLGGKASEHLLKTKLQESGSYSQLVGFYGEIGLLEKAARLRARMKAYGMIKNPGFSWIELKDRVHVFYSGVSSSPLITEIHATLKGLQKTMKPKLVDEFKLL
ncbi:Pentatricopeptide repeat-containing protein [Apostasia shenzhenica]|uniref:Pentatricopeptide repeat-containing protein n=1 Tax=Apostasia shenzhenica TaxID=1088818 RepID=A0A2H9ZWF4_9ASPA|nr:Pentatricopeptide repeat-containing protein [Apostasia shenzhenica]